MKNLEFKSQVATSIEQSKRLLALGLKKETADCYLFEYDKEKYKVIAESWLDLIADKKYYSQYKDVCLPAWSLHRLLMMYGGNYLFFSLDNAYGELIHAIAIDIEDGTFNQDYLEE